LELRTALVNSRVALILRWLGFFVEKEWAPEFAAQFFSNQQIAAMWQQIVRSGNTADRLEFNRITISWSQSLCLKHA
jgi:hypothetical protein